MYRVGVEHRLEVSGQYGSAAWQSNQQMFDVQDLRILARAGLPLVLLRPSLAVRTREEVAGKQQIVFLPRGFAKRFPPYQRDRCLGSMFRVSE